MINRRGFLETLLSGAVTIGPTHPVLDLTKKHSPQEVSHAGDQNFQVNPDNLWQRDDRVFIYQHEGRTRYPSLTLTAKGRLFVLFTRQTKEQEKTETGELVLVPRSLDGEWWIRPRVVFSSQEGIPKAAGTMTTLLDGRIIAPFVVVSNRPTKSTLRVLESKDGGETWVVGKLIEETHLAWIAPNGKPFEIGSEILMPVFGALNTDDASRTRHSCGLLRSSDGGENWREWSLIVAGSSGNFSFEYPAVLPLGDGRIVAVFTARRLVRGAAPQVLMRSFSRDKGRTWTQPEQLCVGAWPSLASVGQGNLVFCAYSTWCPWAEMRMLVSKDGLETFFQDQNFVEHGWLPNLDHYPKVNLYTDKELQIEKGRHFWCYNPIPVPPVVPHLNGDWGSGHFGFPSLVALSEMRLLVVLGNTQKGSTYTDPPTESKLPIGHERIETIAFERITSNPAPKINRVHSRGRWELTESWTPEKWRQVVLGGGKNSDNDVVKPSEFVYPPLKSGRLIKVTLPSAASDSHIMKIIGREKGYWVLHHKRHIEIPKPRIGYSDDRGKTWEEGTVTNPSSLGHLYWPSGQLTEIDEGALVIPCYGYRTKQDMLDHSYSSAIVRSTDGEKLGKIGVL